MTYWSSASVCAADAGQLVQDLLSTLAALGQVVSGGDWWQSDDDIVHSVRGSTRMHRAARPNSDGSDLVKRLEARCSLHPLSFKWALHGPADTRTKVAQWSIIVQRCPRVGAIEDRFRIYLSLEGRDAAAVRSLPGFERCEQPSSPEGDYAVHSRRAAEDRLRLLEFDPTTRPAGDRGPVRLYRVVSTLPRTAADFFARLSNIGWLGLDGWLRRDVGLVVVAPLLVAEQLDERWQEDRNRAREALADGELDRLFILRWLACHDPDQAVVILSPKDVRILHWAAASFGLPVDFSEGWFGAKPCCSCSLERPALVEELRRWLLDGRATFAYPVTLLEGAPALVTWSGVSAAMAAAWGLDAAAELGAVARAVNAAVRRSLEPAFDLWRSSPAEATPWQAEEPLCADDDALPSWVRDGAFPHFDQIVAAGWCTSLPGLESVQPRYEELRRSNPDLPVALSPSPAGGLSFGFYVSIGRDGVIGGHGGCERYGWFPLDEDGLRPKAEFPAEPPRLSLICLPRSGSAADAWHASPITLPAAAPEPDQLAELEVRFVKRERDRPYDEQSTLPRSWQDAQGWRLAIEVKSAEWPAPSNVTDAGAYLRSANRSGPTFIWTCSCGIPECEGIHWPIVVRHTETKVLWIMERPVYGSRSGLRWCEVIAFARAAYLEQARRVLAEIRVELGRMPPAPQEDDSREHPWLFGWFGFSADEARSVEI